jgi:hypothetical protein
MNTFSPGYALPEKIPASMAAAEDLDKIVKTIVMGF